MNDTSFPNDFIAIIDSTRDSLKELVKIRYPQEPKMHFYLESINILRKITRRLNGRILNYNEIDNLSEQFIEEFNKDFAYMKIGASIEFNFFVSAFQSAIIKYKSKVAKEGLK